MDWLTTSLREYPEIAVFLALSAGYWIGGKSFKGFSLGSVTGTLLAGILIGQLGITVSGPLKSFCFLMFLFAVGYGIGPQFVRGLAKDGLPQAAFAVAQCVLSLLFPALIAKLAGYDLGLSAGLLAGSQTISAAMGLATDAINRAGLSPGQAHSAVSGMPVAYAVTYIFGTIGSAFILAQILPSLMRINLSEACEDFRKKNQSGPKDIATDGTAWHAYELRAYKVERCASDLTVGSLETGFQGKHVFVEGLRSGGKAVELLSSTPIRPGDILAIGGDHAAVVKLETTDTRFSETEDKDLLCQPETGEDVFVTKKKVNGKTLGELAGWADAHGVFLRKIKRGLTGTEIPILPTTTLHRGDVLTLYGLDKNVKKAARDLGTTDIHSKFADVATFAAAIVIGALIGSLTFKVGGIPLTLSTAGGALIAGLVFGWIRSVHPTFGFIPEPSVWFMNSVGLNVFIAVVGLSAGPNFVQGLKEQGAGLFLWGMLATALPLVGGALIGRYIFKFHPAILFGCCAGSRTTTAALGMINEKAKSNIPSLGYTVTYAVGNTLLTIWGLVIILLLS